MDRNSRSVSGIRFRLYFRRTFRLFFFLSVRSSVAKAGRLEDFLRAGATSWAEVDDDAVGGVNTMDKLVESVKLSPTGVFLNEVPWKVEKASVSENSSKAICTEYSRAQRLGRIGQSVDLVFIGMAKVVAKSEAKAQLDECCESGR